MSLSSWSLESAGERDYEKGQTEKQGEQTTWGVATHAYARHPLPVMLPLDFSGMTSNKHLFSACQGDAQPSCSQAWHVPPCGARSSSQVAESCLEGHRIKDKRNTGTHTALCDTH